jgi:hypothetical protein
VGKPFQVVKQLGPGGPGYGHVVSEWDTYEEAHRAMIANPGTKIVQGVDIQQTQQNRNKVLEHSQQTNPDLDGSGAAPTTGTSLRPRNDAVDTPEVRDVARHRQVKTNPDVDARADQRYRLQHKSYN